MNKNVLLKEIPEITTLIQYLYSGKSIRYFNGIINIKIKMNDKMHIFIRPTDKGESRYEDVTNEMTILVLLDIIKTLKETKSKNGIADTRWEEIENEVSLLISQN